MNPSRDKKSEKELTALDSRATMATTNRRFWLGSAWLGEHNLREGKRAAHGRMVRRVQNRAMLLMENDEETGGKVLG